MIPLVYLIWALVALVVFAFAPRKYAPWLCLIGGWVLLPPAVYPAYDPDSFAFWALGGSLPSDVLISKAWIAPAATCLASFVFDMQRWRSTSIRIWDAPIVLFCLWPIAQHIMIGGADAVPAGWVSSLYLVGSWALPWWLGRMYMRDHEDMRHFALILALTTLVLVPVAIFEGAFETRIHTILYGQHPHAANGVERYIGYRPQAFFENGNQYGFWCAGASVAAFWLVREGRIAWPIAAVLAAMTIASQSVGGVALMVFGMLALMWANSFELVLKYGRWAALAGVVTAALMIAGLLPVRAFIENTGVGQALLDAIRSTGRGSFAWRISQDLKAAPLLREHLIIGHATWDWFMTMKSRPWGFPLLLVGQFGLIGFSLLILPVVRSFWAALCRAATGDNAAKLATVLVLMAALDAVLNSFLFWPAIVLLAAHNERFQPQTA